MVLHLAFIAASLITNVESTQDDMDDMDFAKFVEVHDNFRQHAMQHAETAGKGCVANAITEAPKGFQALCIGCAKGAAGAVAADIIFSSKKDK